MILQTVEYILSYFDAFKIRSIYVHLVENINECEKTFTEIFKD